jgi:proline iminopeptidase
VLLSLLSSWMLATCAPSPAAAAHAPGRFVQVLGQRLWVEEDGSGPPLLLIPGGPGGSHDVFHPWLLPLSRRFRVITYDGYGRGRSAKAASPREYSFQRDVEEVEALRQALGIERWAVFGHSYGGFVAEAHAVAHPQRVQRLVLSNAMIRGADWQRANERYNVRLAVTFPELWAKVEALRAAGVKEGDPRLQAAYGDRFAEQFALFLFWDHRLAARIVFDDSTFNQALYLAICGDDCDFQIGPAMLAVDFRTTLPRLGSPLLVLAGRADGIVAPDLSLEFLRAVPGARRVVFEQSGHLPFVEEPERYLRVLEEFLLESR